MTTAFQLKGNANRALAAATIGFFFGVMAISLFGPTSTTLAAAMNLTPTEMGLLVAIPSLTGSLLRIPFGAGVDANGGRKGFIFLLSAACVGLISLCILFTLYHIEQPGSLTGMFPVVLLLGCLTGCGIATFSVGVSQSSYWFPKHRQGYASGIYGGLGTTSAGLLAFCLPLLLHNFGFTVAYYVLAGVMLLGLIIYAWLSANPPYFQLLHSGRTPEQAHEDAVACGQELFPSGNAAESLKISARIPQTWMLVLTYFTTFGGFMALTAWFPTVWKQGYGLSPMLAGILTAIFSILAALLRVPGGQLSDKIGGVKVSMGALILLAIAGLLMNIPMGWGGLFIISLLISVAFGFNNAATMKLVPVYVSNGVGGANGWVGGLGAFGGFAIPPLMGKLVAISPEHGYGLGFLIFTVLALLNIIINYFGMVKKKA
jgi:NNP family nitrate/nitrite transporter-like MFS transporter